MSRIIFFIFFLFSVFLVSISTIAKTSDKGIRIASFNSLFLYDEIDDSGKIPRDRRPRKGEDFLSLRKTVLSSDPDLIGLQEIENAEAARKIVSSEYECRATNTPGYTQEIGLCWKKSFGSPKTREIQELSLRPGLRKGLLSEFEFPRGKLSVLVVHLKAGRSSRDRSEREEQIRRISEILPNLGDFVLLGDFNENLASRPSLWKILKGGSVLRSANHRQKADCWQHKENFIDYLITNLEWKKGSFRQTKFDADDGNFDGRPVSERGLSDHCPISAELLF